MIAMASTCEFLQTFSGAGRRHSCRGCAPPSTATSNWYTPAATRPAADRNALLHIISCYLPCEGSLQLGSDRPTRPPALEARHPALLEEIMTTAPGDIVVAAGDLNAKTGTAQPWALPPWMHCRKRGSQRNAPSCC